MVVLTNGHDDVLNFFVKEINIFGPPPNFIELNLVFLIRIKLIGAGHILSDHLHEKAVENVHGLSYILL